MADLEDSSSADAFAALLEKGPVTISMADYGGFEKVGALGTTLPRNDRKITTQPGDVILYGGEPDYHLLRPQHLELYPSGKNPQPGGFRGETGGGHRYRHLFPILRRYVYGSEADSRPGFSGGICPQVCPAERRYFVRRGVEPGGRPVPPGSLPGDSGGSHGPGTGGQLLPVSPDHRKAERHHPAGNLGNSHPRRLLRRLAQGLGGLPHGKRGVGGSRASGRKSPASPLFSFFPTRAASGVRTAPTRTAPAGCRSSCSPQWRGSESMWGSWRKKQVLPTSTARIPSPILGCCSIPPNNENRTPFWVSCLCFQGLDSARFFRVSPVRRYTVQSVMGSAPRDR